MSKKEKEHHSFQFEGWDEPHTTQVPDIFFDFIAPQLSEAELRVLIYILRRTYGFKKNSDAISLGQMVDGITTKQGRVLDYGTGMSRRGVMKGCGGLAGKGYVTVEKRRSELGDSDINVYRLRFRRDNATLVTGVGNKVPYGREPSAPPVGNHVPPQQTVVQNTDLQHGVVVTYNALTKFGVSKAAAAKLAGTYPEPYILSKLDLVQWLVETGSSLVGKNPAGYLRRAIEEDYAAPPKYKPSSQRQAAANTRELVEHEEQERRREAEADYARAKVLDQQKLVEQYPPEPIPGTPLTTHQAWEQTLDQLHTQVTRPNFEMWLRPTTLVSCDGQRAVIAAPSRYHADTLSSRLNPLVQHALSTVLDAPVHCQYVPVPELLDAEAVSTNGQTAHTAQHSTGTQSAAVSPRPSHAGSPQ